MKKTLFIAVVNVGDYRKETYMRRFEDESALLKNVANLETKETLERIFNVDEFGKVTHSEIVFEGRLKLKEVPPVYKIKEGK